MLQTGATPERLAWSLAIGFVIGVNPLLGSTTLVALAIASALRLNIVASQLANHLAYPLELLMFPLFVGAGSRLFRGARLPLQPEELFRAVRLHPWSTTHLMWRYEWHALVAWAIFAAVAAPLLAVTIRPGLERLLGRSLVSVIPEAEGS